MGVLIFVVGALCVNFVVCENVYKAAFATTYEQFGKHSSLIQEAAHLNADILVLPSPKAPEDDFANIEDYDEIIKSLSRGAKQAGVYVVAHLLEKAQCQNKEELVRSNLVFDRHGTIVAVYRKPANSHTNCTASSHIPIFATDFGVTFGVVMEEDLVLQTPDHLKVKNFVFAGPVHSDVPFLSGSQFASSWAYVTNANVLTSSGVYAGRAGFKTAAGRVAVVKLNKDGGLGNAKCTSTNAASNVAMEDLSQYVIRPLDMEATLQGYSNTVCHGRFCCQFYVKTSFVGSPQHEVSYGLASFAGVRHFAGSSHIGAQSCSIVACAGLYKRSCALGPNNSTNTNFEKIVIRGNFTAKNSAQFPVVMTTSQTQMINFETENSQDFKNVAISIENGSNLLNFGIFGRDYSKDFESASYTVNIDGAESNYYDYIFNEEVLGFFDYVWIRLRVLIFFVSIYVLEMM